MNRPANLDEISACIRDLDRVAIAGAGSKPRLGRSAPGASTLSMLGYAGIIAYQPSEYTVCVRAGTPISEVAHALAERGQYLPFEPLWAGRNATVGGTIAANATGPGRVRFGGIRDFIIGVTLVDGSGRVIRGGGKVVKNAAGFDLPKFMVGSLGRWGAIAEVTFKVFPAPAHSVSRLWTCASHAEASRRMAAVARSRWEPTAIEYDPGKRQIWIRLSGSESSLKALAAEVGGDAGPDEPAWRAHTDFAWADPRQSLLRVPVSLTNMTETLEKLGPLVGRSRVGGAGNTLWINTPEFQTVADALTSLGRRGLNHHATADPLWSDHAAPDKIHDALQAVFDPAHRFDAYC